MGLNSRVPYEPVHRVIVVSNLEVRAINMKGVKRFVRRLALLNWKTIYFNFKYLPIRQAAILPVIISNKVRLANVKGVIAFECPLRPGMVSIGFEKTTLFDYKTSRSIWDVAGKVVFKGDVIIGQGSRIIVGVDGTLVFGHKVMITAQTSIVAYQSISLGDNCLFSWDILIMDTDFHAISDNQGSILNPTAPIFIEDQVWIGCRSILLKGSMIPKGCIIGAGSLVNKPLSDVDALYAGTPVKKLRDNVKWHL